MMCHARVWGLLAATLTSSGCGGGGHATADAADASADVTSDVPADVASDPLAAFSAATNATFHLIADGRTVDGHGRVLYAPRVMYLAPSPALAPSLSSAAVGQGRSVNGIFAAFGGNPADVGQLIAEANAHAITLVHADLAIPHRVCGTSDVLDGLTWHDSCSASARQISFATVGLGATATNGGALDARIAPHLGDGSGWDDVVQGGVTWHLTDGRVLESKLEISCIGSFAANGDAVLFDSPACRARYALAR